MVEVGKISLEFLYEELNRWKTELRSSIASSEAKILRKFDFLDEKLCQLERENCELKKEIEYLKRDNKKNNFLIFGLNRAAQDLSVEFVCDTVRNLIGVPLTDSDINNYYLLGRSIRSPVKVELTTYLKKQLIFENCRKLKGTGVSIAHDLTEEQREELRELRAYLPHHSNPEKPAYIRGNKLVVGTTRYTLEDLKNSLQGPVREPNGELGPSATGEELETSVSKMRDRFEANNQQDTSAKSKNRRDLVGFSQKRKTSDNNVQETRDKLRSRVNSNKAAKNP